MASVEGRKRDLIQAIMGAGKSVLLTEVVASCVLGRMERIIVTTSSVDLVEQLAKTVGQRIGMRRIGKFYTRAKQVQRPVIICCDDSAVPLAKALSFSGIKVPLVIADEAHKTECDSYLEAAELWNPGAILGFTATPFRGLERDSLTLFDNMPYRYGPREALRDGVVVPWKIVPWWGEEIDLDEACVEIVEQAEGAGVVSASSVADADEFVEKLAVAGIAAASLHYRSGRRKKAEVLEALRLGRLRCVVAVNMLTEGVDLPYLAWLLLRRRMSSRVAFAQFVGRALRAHPGKTEAVLYDPWNLFDTYRISYDAALQGGSEEEEEEIDEADAPPPEQREAEERRLKARKLGDASAFLVRLMVALSSCDVVRPPRESSALRARPASQHHIAAIERLAPRLANADMPDAVRAGLADVYRMRYRLTSGQASDFTELVFKLPFTGWPEQATALIGG